MDNEEIKKQVSIFAFFILFAINLSLILFELYHLPGLLFSFGIISMPLSMYAFIYVKKKAHVAMAFIGICMGFILFTGSGFYIDQNEPKLESEDVLNWVRAYREDVQKDVLKWMKAYYLIGDSGLCN